ncbi:MAG TPA: signal peptidase I [Chitinophagaceae bacterium]|jgi:signal peptidase I|nr:signal peptidase I [Chitinophagaceae bacterium]
MRRPLKWFLIVTVILFGIWVVARLTHALQWHSVSSGANEPVLKQGERFFSSMLVKPDRFDLICFKAYKEHFGPGIYTYRLCGLPGDRVEIREGVLYVNGKNADKGRNLILPYELSVEDAVTLGIREEERTLLEGGKKVMAHVERNKIAESRINARRIIQPRSQPEDYIAKRFGSPWNGDHFGPVTVPPGQYFLLGDNRSMAADSRYYGFVPVHAFMGTVIGEE